MFLSSSGIIVGGVCENGSLFHAHIIPVPFWHFKLNEIYREVGFRLVTYLLYLRLCLFAFCDVVRSEVCLQLRDLNNTVMDKMREIAV